VNLSDPRDVCLQEQEERLRASESNGQALTRFLPELLRLQLPQL
jgi:hypothetical protein